MHLKDVIKADAKMFWLRYSSCPYLENLSVFQRLLRIYGVCLAIL
jgi:hypothetical protein